MATVVLGNVAPVEVVKPDPTATDVERTALEGKTITTFVVPEEETLANALKTITEVFRSHHSDDDPEWVWSTDEILASAVAREFDCPVSPIPYWPEDEPQLETPEEDE